MNENFPQMKECPVIDKGAYILTAAIDLSGPSGKKPKLLFKDIVAAIESCKELNNQSLEVLPCEVTLSCPENENRTVRNRVSIDSLRPSWLFKLDDSEYKRLALSEYMLKDSVDSSMHDEFLYRNLVRKASILTAKGRDGLVAIKLLEIDDLDVFVLETNRNEGVRPHGRLLLNPNDEQIKEIHWFNPEVKKKEYKVKLHIYAQLLLENPELLKDEASVDKNDLSNLEVGRVGTVTLILEPQHGGNLFDLVRKADSIYIDLDKNKQGSKFLFKQPSGKSCIFDFSSVAEHYIDHDNNGIPLYDFLGAFAWIGFVERIREKNYSQLKAEKIPEHSNELIDPEKFADKLHELKEYISFEYSVLCVEHNWVECLDKAENLEKADDNFIALLSSLLGLDDWVGTPGGAHRYLREHGKRSFLLGRSTVLCPPNKAVAFSDKSLFPQNSLSSNIIDYSEWGTKWGVSWAMIWEGMLCSLAETFLLYNEEIEGHVKEKKAASELADITKKAFRDFATYFDVDIIQSHIYRHEFELAKEVYGINNYHKILKEQLDLFSNYEISETNAKISERLGYLTIVVGVSSVIIPVLLKFL